MDFSLRCVSIRCAGEVLVQFYVNLHEMTKNISVYNKLMIWLSLVCLLLVPLVLTRSCCDPECKRKSYKCAPNDIFLNGTHVSLTIIHEL